MLHLQISLDLSVTDKFCGMLKASLYVLSQILEVATLTDIGKYAEEFLNYLKSTISLEPTDTVLCVQQVDGRFGFIYRLLFIFLETIFLGFQIKPIHIYTNLKIRM